MRMKRPPGFRTLQIKGTQTEENNKKERKRETNLEIPANIF
jgi:hypothetical protein